MDVVWHHYISTDTKIFILDAITYAIKKDINRLFFDEYWKPIDYCKGYKIDPDSLDKAVAIHLIIIE